MFAKQIINKKLSFKNNYVSFLINHLITFNEILIQNSVKKSTVQAQLLAKGLF